MIYPPMGDEKGESNMSVSQPGFHIPRRSVAGHENEWSKMFDPPTESPPTPDLVSPNNPVPAFIAANVPNATMIIPNTVRRILMHGTNITMWDGAPVKFFTFSDPDIPQTAGGTYPGPTIRVPRGAIFHGWTQGKGPPPHTIHWHGIEPTPMNDGVGHCSMEVGTYTYQWQPNFIGTYFYHCHRNTVQHFEFGLFGMLLVEPPDAYDPSIPINAGGPPKNVGGYPRRIAANLTDFPGMFPDFVGGDLASGDPHAMTVPYDVEALWVLDDIDSVWRTQAANAKATYPAMGTQPGVNDLFRGNAGVPALPTDFFAFNDFNPDYFAVSGVNFPGYVGDTVSIPAGVTIPPTLNSGVLGMQVSVNAPVNKTILIRSLCAAYINVKVSFPIDVLVIAFDGRALGVPPYGQYNHPFVLTAGTPIELSTARRFDVLMRSATPVNSFADVEFIHSRDGQTLMKGRIPVVIS